MRKFNWLGMAIASLSCFGIFYLTLTGDLQKWICFAGPDNEIVFADMIFFLGLLTAAWSYLNWKDGSKESNEKP